MKLLYIWIEEFRTIFRQGIVIDNEYIITVKNQQKVEYDYYTADGQKMAWTGDKPRNALQVFYRQIECHKNSLYCTTENKSTIESIAALVGENAVGKTNILECLISQDHEMFCIDDRHYFLAFLDEKKHCVEIRSRGIHLTGDDIICEENYTRGNYIKYAIPLTNYAPGKDDTFKRDTKLVFLTSPKVSNFNVEYYSLYVPTVVGNLSAFSSRDSFDGVFEFFCKFPHFSQKENRLVIALHPNSGSINNEVSTCFTDEKCSSQQYKIFFIYRLAKILFSSVASYFDKRHPAGFEIDQKDVKYFECSAFNIQYPRENERYWAAHKTDSIPKKEIKDTLTFFESFNKRSLGDHSCDQFIKILHQVFNTIYTLDESNFTAFYKVEIPFEEKYAPFVMLLQKCIRRGRLNDYDLTDGVNIDFEWLSQGEQHIAMLFSAFFQKMDIIKDRFTNQDIIWFIDEPEMHMHPEVGRRFVRELEYALRPFKESGVIKRCQFVFATHSPFIIQSLDQYNGFLTLVSKEDRLTKTFFFEDLPGLKLPGRNEFSFNLIMYKIFGIPTTELHDELYGELQILSEKDREKDFDKWLNQNGILMNMNWRKVKNKVVMAPEKMTLQTYIRNSIHHPENRENEPYTSDNLRESIDQMISLLYDTVKRS